jgi:hypothetical protein
MKLVFGDIVVVDRDQIGVVVKCWGRSNRTTEYPEGREPHVEVYVRNYNQIEEYPVSDVQRYQVRHKELDEDEIEYQKDAERQEG